MEKNPHLFNIVLSQLPTDVFAESTNIPPKSEKRRNKRQSSPTISDASQDPFSSIRSKNLAMENKIIVEQNKIMLEQGLQLSNEIRVEKKRDVSFLLSFGCTAMVAAKLLNKELISTNPTLKKMKMIMKTHRSF